MNIETRFSGSLRDPARFREAPTPSESTDEATFNQAPAFQWQRFDANNPADRAPLLASAVRILEDGRQQASEKQRAIEALKSIGYGWDRTMDPSENLMMLRSAVQHEKQRERQRQEQMANTEAFQKYYRENIEQHVPSEDTTERHAVARTHEGPATYRTAPQETVQPPTQKEAATSGWRGVFKKASSGLRSLFRQG
jgi:hypothetical protein